MKTETSAKRFIFPDIEPFLCPNERITLEQSIHNYRKALIDTGNCYCIAYANKLLEYLEATPNIKDFSQYVAHMKKWKKQNNYNFEFDFFMRKKSFIKYNEKIRLYILKALDAKTFEEREKFSLDRICDVIGVRGILDFGKEDSAKTIDMCYKFLNETINFFTKEKGYTIKLAEPLVDVGFCAKEHPNVVVPKESKILEAFDVNVKDYYLTPKKNGYQSLHIVFKSPKGIPIEIQIRTFATHMRVEFEPSCNHDSHDNARYPERINLNLDKINISGFGYYAPGKVFDTVSLIQSIDPFVNF